MPLANITQLKAHNLSPTASYTFGNATVTGNVSAGNVSASRFYWANGTPFSSSSYGNTDVAAYLTGNVIVGNVRATGYYFANGTPFISGTGGGGTYGNTDVASYLPVYSGNITANNITANGRIIGGGVRYTVASTAPANAVVGDTWYNTTSDILFKYVSDGVSSYWVDQTGSTVELQTYGNTQVDAYLGSYYTYANANAAAQTSAFNTLDANVGAYQTWANSTFGTSSYGDSNAAAYLLGNITVGNVIPADDSIQNLGSDTKRFGSLYLSGNTIYLGNTVITENTQLGTITFIPPATNDNPNPTAVVFTSNGSINAYTTIDGNVTANTTTPNFSNVSAVSVYSESYFYANGTAFTGGGGTGLDNLDGGTPYSVYGGLTAIDGGGVT